MRILLLLVLLPLASFADTVVPIDAVENSVNIRLSPDATSEIVGKLEQGSSAVWVTSIEGWYEIQIEGGATGFISADWSRIVVAAPAASEPADPPVDDVISESTDEPASEPAEVAPVEVAAAAGDVIETEVSVDEVADEAAEIVVEPIADTVAEAPPEVVLPETFTGTKNFVVKFRDAAGGGNSQIYDNGNRVGVGTTDPKQRLEVNGSIQIHEQNSSVAGLMITQSSGDTGYIMHNRASTLTIGAGSQDRITIDRDGNVGFGVSRPDHPLEMESGAHVTAGGAWTNSSSRHKKENVTLLSATDAVGVLMQLDPVMFNYKAEQDEDYLGFIAEDVPELVATNARDAISSMDIIAVLTRVVQEQQIKIKELEQRLDAR